MHVVGLHPDVSQLSGDKASNSDLGFLPPCACVCASEQNAVAGIVRTASHWVILLDDAQQFHEHFSCWVSQHRMSKVCAVVHNFGRAIQAELTNIGAFLGRTLQERNTQLSGQRLACIVRHSPAQIRSDRYPFSTTRQSDTSTSTRKLRTWRRPSRSSCQPRCEAVPGDHPACSLALR